METKPITKHDDSDKPLRFEDIKSGFLIRVEAYNELIAKKYHPEKLRDLLGAALEQDKGQRVLEDVDFALDVSRTYEYDDEPKQKQKFAAIENRVHDNLRRLVCRARSGNMAKRIARALNIVQPNERGQ